MFWLIFVFYDCFEILHFIENIQLKKTFDLKNCINYQKTLLTKVKLILLNKKFTVQLFPCIW